MNVPGRAPGPAAGDRARPRGSLRGRSTSAPTSSPSRSCARRATSRELRAAMGDRYVPIVAKIETRPAVDDIEGILVEADAVMIARGDLGRGAADGADPVDPEGARARGRAQAGRPAIVATQMLESMIHAPRPTRAEATDVANAVLDGADAVMLSGETAVGDYPFESALAASTIAGFVEAEGRVVRDGAAARAGTPAKGRPSHTPPPRSRASELGVVAITCYTETGRTARLLLGRAPAGAGLRVRPAARRPADHVPAVGRRGAARDAAHRHGRHDRADGRRACRPTGSPSPATPW